MERVTSHRASHDHPTGVFTVDVEDWFHPLVKDPERWGGLEDRVLRPTLRLLEELEATGNRATFFVLGWIAERHPELVRRMIDGGHEIGCHGHHHLSLAWIDAERFRADLVMSLEALRAAGACDVISFRAPYFSMNRGTAWALPVLAENGFRIDSSVFPLKLGYYGQRAAPNGPHRWWPLIEFPITLPTFAGARVPLTGGFYARFFPVTWTLAGVDRVFSRRETPMFYVHPWELDTDQPHIEASRFLHYRHYLRLERTLVVIRRLLERWRWGTLRDAAARGGI
jgi:polysaccharide deacetylase family protein (PEP-CTERM system associated)